MVSEVRKRLVNSGLSALGEMLDADRKDLVLLIFQCLNIPTDNCILVVYDYQGNVVQTISSNGVAIYSGTNINIEEIDTEERTPIVISRRNYHFVAGTGG